MFKKNDKAQRPRGQQQGSLTAETCPKCGCPEVVGDNCPRCRVRISAYRIHLAALGKGAPVSRASGERGGWLQKLLMVVPTRRAATGASQRARYERLIADRIYRELHWPGAIGETYVVLVAFDLSTEGHARALQLAVYPPNPEVAVSVRAAIGRAEPFPLPSADARSAGQRVSLALTVNV